MQLQNYLLQHKIYVEDRPLWAELYRARWLQAFAPQFTKEQLEKIHVFSDRYACGYLWHIFSYERISALMREEATSAFQQVHKKGCYIFYNHGNEVLFVKRGDLLDASFFAQEEDVYVVDEHFTWTYVVTHESYCGPYFTKAGAQ